MKKPPQNYRSFESLKTIISSLQDPDGGCPWDLEQTHKSLCKFAIEETYELVDAIEQENIDLMKEELGDVLLQVMLHAEMAKKDSKFEIEDVIEGIGKKMVRRHPHVFADTSVNSSKEVLQNWEKIKLQEKANRSSEKKWFDFPSHLPALSVAEKIGNKSQKYDFDWKTLPQVYDKVTEELAEVTEAIQLNDLDKIEDEIGDLLFVVAQLARHYKLDPEQALRRSNGKFIKRFTEMMKLAEEKSLDFVNLPLEQKEELWQEVKRRLHAKNF